MEFYKYQGTGNDFVMIDNRDFRFPKRTALIKHLCDRRFGIGADGLILLENDDAYDFRMVYYNADGKESSMCGNGGRCIVAFAHFLGIFTEQTRFIAIDGPHEAQISRELVKLKMMDVNLLHNFQKYTVVNTGSPHYVEFVDNVQDMDVYTEGKSIRYNEIFQQEGINVNFATPLSDDMLFVRTYERGVEDETYSCGTGATACALAFMQNHHQTSINIKVLGGALKVYTVKTGKGFHNVWLEGPAQQVFKGHIAITE
ncbi:diaminopimelate epimerase [Elizabethkingia argentiflava]|uniref:Diaminopimelate epimerase n=1 Tax=Elizabethkingia argenteiflava TaxID=2681556 RepID=A0A845PVU2_9FLAO|nr:diaminopimelate epimerase [Elizabethkingia argenteiflava]NAW50986.1 diaminopimelate epimerase [Elizabethkingia argenteiflava]